MDAKIRENDAQVVDARKERDCSVVASAALEQSLKGHFARQKEMVAQLAVAQETIEANSKALAVLRHDLEKGTIERVNFKKRIEDLRQLVETSEKR